MTPKPAPVTQIAPSAVPDGLGEEGTTLWVAITSEWNMDVQEVPILLAACRLADELARLEEALADAPTVVTGAQGQSRAHPLFSETRAHRLALKQLLGSLGIHEEDSPEARSAHGRRLARARWSK